MISIKDHIQGECQFLKYKDGNLWYITGYTNFEFPVPIDDIGTATFERSIKELLMMRYIRKWIEVTNATVV